MSRSLWKGVFIDPVLLNYKKFMMENNNIVLFNRSNIILPEHLNKNINVYNGKDIFNLKITRKEMVGHKIGEFSFTRKKCSKKQKKELKKSKK